MDNLVAVEDIPGRSGAGQIKLTYQRSGIAPARVLTTVRAFEVPAPQAFLRSSFISYSNADEREALLRKHRPDAIAG